MHRPFRWEAGGWWVGNGDRRSDFVGKDVKRRLLMEKSWRNVIVTFFLVKREQDIVLLFNAIFCTIYNE